MKDNEVRPKAGGLGQSKGKGLLLRRQLGSEEDGGGSTPTWLEGGGHKTTSSDGNQTTQTSVHFLSKIVHSFDVATGKIAQDATPKGATRPPVPALPSLKPG